MPCSDRFQSLQFHRDAWRLIIPHRHANVPLHQIARLPLEIPVQTRVPKMAASGSFHKQCHDHADDPAHECVVTLMLGGGYAGVVPDIVPVDVVAEPPQVPVLAPKALRTVPSHLAGGILAHAPPRGP